MDHFTISFEDCRWPDQPRATFAVEAENRRLALDAALAEFRRTLPLENLAYYVACCQPALEFA